MQLIASAGVSHNKFLAKMASDMDKPDGLYVITPDQGEAFVAALLIGKFHGVGPATEAKMHRLGIKTGADLKAWDALDLTAHFGKSGGYYYHIARGVDLRPVRSSRQRKSLGKETTFAVDICDTTELLAHINVLAETVFKLLLAKKMQAKTVTLKVKYSNFRQITRSISLPYPIEGFVQMQALLADLFTKTDAHKQSVRLLGVTVSGLITEDQDIEKQLTFDLNVAE